MREAPTKLKSQEGVQHGGSHYKDMAIEPALYCELNKFSWIQGEIIKLVSRYNLKQGLLDLQKAGHYLQQLMEIHYGQLSTITYAPIEPTPEQQVKEFIATVGPGSVECRIEIGREHPDAEHHTPATEPARREYCLASISPEHEIYIQGRRYWPYHYRRGDVVAYAVIDTHAGVGDEIVKSWEYKEGDVELEKWAKDKALEFANTYANRRSTN